MNGPWPWLLGFAAGAGLAAWWLRARGSAVPRAASPAERLAADPSLPIHAWVLDVSAVQAALAAPRAAGVTDFVAHLRAHPEFRDACRRSLKLRWSTAAALTRTGCADAAALERLLATGGAPHREIFEYQLTSLWAGRHAIEEEYEFTDAAGTVRTWFVQSLLPAPDRPAGEIAVFVTDVTASNAAVAARIEDFAELRRLLAQANILLWGAKVRREAGLFQWRIHVPPHAIDSALYHMATAIDKGGLWDHDATPDFETMKATAENALLAGAARYGHEYRLLRGGRTHWLAEEVSVQPLGPDEWSLVGIVTDATRRHEAEFARQASASQLEQILERADCMLWQAALQQQPDGSVEWDSYVPESVLHERLFGPRAGPRRRIDWNAARVPELPAMHERCWRAMHDGSAGYEQEFRAYNGDRMFWLHEQVSITRPAPGRWLLVGVITDITARRETEAALAAEKERLAVTLRAMEESVVTTDTDGRVQFVNRAAGTLMRADAGDPAQRRVGELFVFHDARSGGALDVPLGEVVSRGVVFEFPGHAALRDAAGRERLIAGCCAPVRDARSSIIGTVLVFRDITEQRRLAAELQQASKLESVGLLAGGIAHDFNNILTVVLGNLSLALLEAKGLSFVERSLEAAQKATVRARDLTQQLLTFSKGGDPVRTAVHLPGVVVEVAQFALHGTKVKCEYDLPSDLWPADADKGQVGQIVQNLVINACQAMPDGGTIRLVARNHPLPVPGALPLEPGDFLKISVADTGPGIPPEHLARVFDPYFTTKKSGSGLGLATVFSIVRRHRGHVEVESKAGVGATFHVWLPALRAADAPAASTASTGHRTMAGRVLFMDDEAPIRELAARLMTRLGLRVELAADGAEAVRLYREALAAQEPFNVVVMDLTVPGGLGGREALQQIRQIDPGVRAIVSSGYSGDPVMADFRAHGFSGVVRKPYELQEFAGVLQAVLRGERL